MGRFAAIGGRDEREHSYGALAPWKFPITLRSRVCGNMCVFGARRSHSARTCVRGLRPVDFPIILRSRVGGIRKRFLALVDHAEREPSYGALAPWKFPIILRSRVGRSMGVFLALGDHTEREHSYGALAPLNFPIASDPGLAEACAFLQISDPAPIRSENFRSGRRA